MKDGCLGCFFIAIFWVLFIISDILNESSTYNSIETICTWSLLITIGIYGQLKPKEDSDSLRLILVRIVLLVVIMVGVVNLFRWFGSYVNIFIDWLKSSTPGMIIAALIIPIGLLILGEVFKANK